MIILLWKITEGYVEGYSVTFFTNPRRGRLAVVHFYIALCLRHAREASLSVRGAKLFNCVPPELRNMSGATVDQFKSGLDSWLATVADEPTVPGCPRAAVTNSLLDQTALHHVFNPT